MIKWKLCVSYVCMSSRNLQSIEFTGRNRSVINKKVASVKNGNLYQDYKETMDYVGNKYRLIILIICFQFVVVLLNKKSLWL